MNNVYINFVLVIFILFYLLLINVFGVLEEIAGNKKVKKFLLVEIFFFFFGMIYFNILIPLINYLFVIKLVNIYVENMSCVYFIF